MQRWSFPRIQHMAHARFISLQPSRSEARSCKVMAESVGSRKRIGVWRYADVARLDVVAHQLHASFLPPRRLGGRTPPAAVTGAQHVARRVARPRPFAWRLAPSLRSESLGILRPYTLWRDALLSLPSLCPAAPKEHTVVTVGYRYRYGAWGAASARA